MVKLNKINSLCALVVLITSICNTTVCATDRDTARLESEVNLAEITYVINNRPQIISAIVERWSAEMDANDGWLAEITTALEAANNQQLLDIQGADSYSAVQAILQGQALPVTIEGISGIEALGSLSQDLVYTPVLPCRFFDTRFDNDAIIPNGSGYQNDYQVYGTNTTLLNQGHTAGTGCPSPKGEPVAISANFTVVPYGKGHIRAWPFDSPQPNASFLNYNTDANSAVANAGIITTCYLCGHDLSVSTWGGAADSLADVMGYFYPLEERAETAQGGYDLEDNTLVAGINQDYFIDGLNSATFIGAFNGNTTMSFIGGEEVLMHGSGSIVNFDYDGVTIDGTYIACYKDTTGNLFEINDSSVSYSAQSPFCTSINDAGHGGTVSVSGRLSSMPAGTYTFGICALTGGNTQCNTATSPHPGYSSIATKIEVTKY